MGTLRFADLQTRRLLEDLSSPSGAGAAVGMGQSKAHLWMHVLWVVLRAALRALGEAPT